MATEADVLSNIKASSKRGPECLVAETTRPHTTTQHTAVEDSQATDGSSDQDQLEEGEEREEDGRPPSDPPLPVGEEPPPLPEGEEPPPLPDEAPPDDGWDAIWDDSAQAYYFYNRVTRVTQWDNPRVPEAGVAVAPGTEEAPASVAAPVQGGYNPAIHGDYDPNADYAIEARAREQAAAAGLDARGQAYQPQAPDYAATGAFNRFTGRWQAEDQNPERHGDDAKSKRQMNAFFDVDAAANSHGGKSLKAERQNKKLSKAELKAFKEKRRGKKEEKRRAWLLD